jgi:ATPase subunit of ABC transporter with duplicated ATPase domains
VQQASHLLLDEPTNHLDVVMVAVVIATKASSKSTATAITLISAV